jgi:spermidine synthase
MSAADAHDSILILGGGDGMAVRELLKYDDVKTIDMVDLDAGMIEVCSTNPNITEINQDSLKSEKLKIHNVDAYEYLEDLEKQYDVIIVDLPDPNSESLNKLYSNIFYRMCKNSLKDTGVMVVQSTSPYYATDAFWCINKTLESEGFCVKPYHLQVPAFGDWGFNMVSKHEISENLQFDVDTKYLSEENVSGLFLFGKDEIAGQVEINHLTKPVLMEYYNRAVEEWN